MNKVLRKTMKIKYSQIGEGDNNNLVSFIYNRFMNENYNIFDLDKSGIERLLKYKNFIGLNINYPYKQTILNELDDYTDQVKIIGESNLVQEYNGKLYGFNTEYFGIIKWLKKYNVNIKGETVTILKDYKSINTLEYVLKSLNVKSYEIIDVKEFYKIDSNSKILFNTVNLDDKKYNYVKYKYFSGFEHIFDMNSSPLFSKLYMYAIHNNIFVYNSLYKILFQEKKTIEILTKQKFMDNVFEDIIDEFVKTKLNVVLIGMPGAGKTTIGKKLARILKKTHIDLDKEFFYEYGVAPSQYLRYESEELFREMEAKVVKKLGLLTNFVISTSGGVVQLLENYYYLKRNSLIFRVDRDLNYLSTNNRPLSKGGIETLLKMNKDRKEKYEFFTDYVVENRGDFNKSALIISEKFNNIVTKYMNK